jgi:hypothetical protein
MGMVARRRFLFWSCAIIAVIQADHLSAAPPPEEVRQAFADIHTDNVPHNCAHATEWLLKYREELKDDLLAELYRTDRQGRDAILHVLFNTESFQPDERFIRFVFARMSEDNRYVKSDMIFKDPLDRLAWSGAHWEAWRYMDEHFELFDPYLKEEIGRTESPFVLWAAAWLAKHRGILTDYGPLFTPEVLRRATVHLRQDQIRYNASRAVRLFLLLGDQSIPVLREVSGDADPQAAMFAQATIDALGGKRKAFGYLVSKLDLSQVLFGPGVQEPEWLSEAAEPYVSDEKLAYR